MIDCRNLEFYTLPSTDRKEIAWKNYWKHSKEVSELLVKFVQ